MTAYTNSPEKSKSWWCTWEPATASSCRYRRYSTYCRTVDSTTTKGCQPGPQKQHCGRRSSTQWRVYKAQQPSSEPPESSLFERTTTKKKNKTTPSETKQIEKKKQRKKENKKNIAATTPPPTPQLPPQTTTTTTKERSFAVGDFRFYRYQKTVVSQLLRQSKQTGWWEDEEAGFMGTKTKQRKTNGSKRIVKSCHCTSSARWSISPVLLARSTKERVCAKKISLSYFQLIVLLGGFRSIPSTSISKR